MINEKDTLRFIHKILEYYSAIDNSCINVILTDKDQITRNNVGWYQHIENQHKIFINTPNILGLKEIVESGIIDLNTYYALITICVGHEFRHFLQGKCIWDNHEIKDFTKMDAFDAQLMLYIRYFFDNYYLLNKKYIKYEEDAELFTIKNDLFLLKDIFPNIASEKAMVNAVNYYAEVQNYNGISSTLPKNCTSLPEIINKITQNIRDIKRIVDLTKSLSVNNSNYYMNHLYYGLSEEDMLTQQLIKKYANCSDDTKQDLLVVKALLANLEKPIESLYESQI